MAKFDSSIFLTDPFFAEPGASDTGYVTIDGDDFRCNYTDELNPQKHAPLISEGGHWRIIHIVADEWEAENGPGNLPLLQTKCTFTEGNETRTFYIRSRYRDGDMIVIQAIGEVRR